MKKTYIAPITEVFILMTEDAILSISKDFNIITDQDKAVNANDADLLSGKKVWGKSGIWNE